MMNYSTKQSTKESEFLDEWNKHDPFKRASNELIEKAKKYELRNKQTFDTTELEPALM